MDENNDTNFDPATVALMHGLKTAEGTNGDYNSIGDEGTAAGIAQWSNDVNGTPQKLSQGQIPANFSSMAKQYNLNGDDFSPENQNKVLYNSIYSDKQQGLQPEQILSKWNSGDPNKYLNPSTSTGTGPVGPYDVAGYVQKGMTAAKQYAEQNNPDFVSPGNDDQKTSDTDFSPADLGMGLVGMIGSTLPFLWKYAKAPLTDAATDAGMGALLGAPEGGVGAIPGALAGAGAGIVNGIVSDVTSGGNQQTPPQTSAPASDSSTETPPPAEEGPTSEVPTEAQNIIADSTKAELNRTIGGRTLSQSPEGNLGIPTMAENGYVPENNNGNADYSSAIEDSKASVTQAANVEKQAAGGSVVPMSEVLATAKQNINSSNVAPDIKQKTLEDLDKISSSYGTGNIDGGEAIEARHQQYAAVGGKNWMTLSNSEIEARKALGTAFRDTSLAHSNNRDLQRAAIFEQQKHISAQKVMKKLHNHPLSKKAMHPFRQQLFKMAATAAEAWIGDKIGGTVGAILGYAAGSQINRVLEKKLKKTNFDTPEMKKALTILRESKPGAFTHFKKTLERNHIEIPDLKEEPRTTEGKEEQVERDIPAIKKNPKKGEKGLIKLPNQKKGK